MCHDRPIDFLLLLQPKEIRKLSCRPLLDLRLRFSSSWYRTFNLLSSLCRLSTAAISLLRLLFSLYDCFLLSFWIELSLYFDFLLCSCWNEFLNWSYIYRKFIFSRVFFWNSIWFYYCSLFKHASICSPVFSSRLLVRAQL